MNYSTGAPERNSMSEPTRLLLVDAGGTIAQVWDSNASRWSYLDDGVPFSWLGNAERSTLAKIADIDYALAEGCSGDSSNRNPRAWGILARQLFEVRNDYDGFVVTHGSATLAYAASMLSYMLADVQKPIICTGAQIPVRGSTGIAESDGIANLIASAQAAAQGVVREVAVLFGHSILRGNRARKANAFAHDAFVSPNFPPLGRVDARGTTYYDQPSKPAAPSNVSASRFVCDDGVEVVPVNPALCREGWSDAYDRARAIMIGGYMAGILPEMLRQPVAALGQNRMVVIYGTADLGPGTEMSSLRRAVPFLPSVAVWAGDMTFEAALMKTCWVLAQTSSLSQQRELFKSNIAGEVSEELLDDR